MAIVTGQQAGLFGGPLFTLLKALTAIKLAEQVSREHHVPAIAVFWVEAEDHDWNEVRSCTVFDDQLEPRDVSLPARPAADPVPVANVILDASIGQIIDDLAQHRPVDRIHASAARRAAGRVCARRRDGGRVCALDRARARRARPHRLRRVGSRLEAAGGGAVRARARHAGPDVQAGDVDRRATWSQRGYHAQVNNQDDSLALFLLDGSRRPIRQQDGRLFAGDQSFEAGALQQEAGVRPARFSPGVLLRPVVQDALFPTACYVAGPNELAYLGQLRGVYEHFGIPMPLMYPRASATLLDSASLRFLTKYQLPLEALQAQDEAALNALLETQIPPAVEESFSAAARSIESQMATLIQAIPAIDPTLEGAAKSTLGRMQHDLQTLHGKMIQAAKRRDDTLRRQFMRARALAFPRGHAQERTIGFVSFLNQYGPALVDRLHEELPLDIGHHWVMAI